ncbi:FKBP-type peptidyl-prolyl cis-trans isomerase [Altererythrobacter sp. GH1-8]|uniref:FKBP-type peptidyl-prolyl cis-trans isomerase n=1 Tax=Altererythrobacter sp. GH1-8 TaxID=3349333 RepID=UPI00374D3D65
MAEVTRVPLQPIAKGSLTKLWLGVIVAILIGAGIAWAAAPKGFSVDTITAGEGPTPQIGEVAFVNYTGRFASTGEEFDSSRDFRWPIPGIMPEGAPFPVEQGATVDGFFEALQQMQVGGKYEVYIPADKGYGDEDRRDPQTGEVRIPANSDLIFEIELVDTMTQEEAQRRFGLLQQAMEAGPPPAPTDAIPGE